MFCVCMKVKMVFARSSPRENIGRRISLFVASNCTLGFVDELKFQNSISIVKSNRIQILHSYFHFGS